MSIARTLGDHGIAATRFNVSLPTSHPTNNYSFNPKDKTYNNLHGKQVKFKGSVYLSYIKNSFSHAWRVPCIPREKVVGIDPYDKEYVSKWIEEVKRLPYWSEYLKTGESSEADEGVVQKIIDKRCIDNIRMLIVDSVQEAQAGHPGLPLGMADVGYGLYRHVMRYNPQNPKWFNRDRFVLSAGHGCLLQYVCLHLAGFKSVQIEDLKRLCHLGSGAPGHPENTLTAGIEVTTGPLGQGVANAVGLALAEKHLAARFNKHDAEIVNHRTFCIMGDGCAMEGISNEAASLAAHWKLNKLTLIYDDNHNTIDGDTSLAFSEDVGGRFRALGWNTITVDNIYESMDTFYNAIHCAFNETEKPTLIQIKSQIGKLSKKEGTAKAHHGTFDKEDFAQMRRKVTWEDRKPFHVIPMVYSEMQKQAKSGERLEAEWNSALSNYRRKYPREGEEFVALIEGKLPSGWESALPKWSEEDQLDATRGYSEKCLNKLAMTLPGLIGGSADLASSNKVQLKDHGDFLPNTPCGRNIHYGIREHAMGGISNGIALHSSGLIPFAATFLIFSDYMKNSMRLSALSHAGVLYILTHDSIGLGEDGPTHQPVEQLAGLRAIPNMLVLRPGDGNETAGAYKVAIQRRDGPCVVALSRQKLSANLSGTSSEGVAKGGYVISDNSGDNNHPELILIGTGSELCLCEGAAKRLRRENRKVRVVSLVCWELFDKQPQEYKDTVLPPIVENRLSVEAGSRLGWKEYVGCKGHVLAVNTFGASGAYLDVFKKFGFTEENITRVARIYRFLESLAFNGAFNYYGLQQLHLGLKTTMFIGLFDSFLHLLIAHGPCHLLLLDYIIYSYIYGWLIWLMDQNPYIHGAYVCSTYQTIYYFWSIHYLYFWSKPTYFIISCIPHMPIYRYTPHVIFPINKALHPSILSSIISVIFTSVLFGYCYYELLSTS